MFIASVRLLPYTLPLHAPWYGAQGRMDQRAGWLVAATDGEGRTGYGDCSPPPSSSPQAQAQARGSLAQITGSWPGRDLESALAGLDAEPDVYPAARCAMETALLDLLARHQGLPLAIWLDPSAGREVLLNASLGRLDPDVMGRAQAAQALGYPVLKAKVGVFPVEDELRRLRALARGLPREARLRLDANGAWNVREAERFVAGLSNLPVDALEEPLADPTPEAFRALQQEAAFALALDESLPLWLAQHGAQALQVRRWVLKPMRLGGLRRCLALARDGARAGVETVITTTVDSAAGVLACLHLAAALDNGLAHGLATSEWLARDLAPLPRPHQGRLVLPPDAGLGLRPFAAALQPRISAVGERSFRTAIACVHRGTKPGPSA